VEYEISQRSMDEHSRRLDKVAPLVEGEKQHWKLTWRESGGEDLALPVVEG
jgi:hypothetical protein